MHVPIFPKEIELIISKIKPKSVIDCTFGAGGHSNIFSKYCENVIAIDRDISVEKFINHDIKFYNDTFSNIDKYVENTDVIFADLGMSTMQLESDRGFSFMSDSDLDMRMGDGIKLKNILNKMPLIKLKDILQKYSEESNSVKIAHNIERYRLKKDINTTFELREAIGFDKFPILARIFQAFRIFINDEMKELEILLEKIPKLTNTSLIITFHSLEDRLVKNAFRKFFKYHGFLNPTEIEILNNPKSRSAKLRFGSNIDIVKTIMY